jgi:hypothetical protein
MKIKVRQRYFKSYPFYIIQGATERDTYWYYTDIDMEVTFDELIAKAQASFRLTQAQQAI